LDEEVQKKISSKKKSGFKYHSPEKPRESNTNLNYPSSNDISNFEN
jgi:hypothetical protein